MRYLVRWKRYPSSKNCVNALSLRCTFQTTDEPVRARNLPIQSSAVRVVSQQNECTYTTQPYISQSISLNTHTSDKIGTSEIAKQTKTAQPWYKKFSLSTSPHPRLHWGQFRLARYFVCLICHSVRACVSFRICRRTRLVCRKGCHRSLTDR